MYVCIVCMFVLVSLCLIEAVSSASQLIVTVMVGERMALRVRKSVFQGGLRQEVCMRVCMYSMYVCVYMVVGRENGTEG